MFKLEALLRSSFARHVIVLVGGTAFAQGLGVIAMPLLTRFYSPADFGILALFSALLSMISVVASLRYQIAIPLPEQDKQAANLLALALICLIFVTALTTGVSLLFPREIAGFMKAPMLLTYLWLLPIAVAATGAYGVFQYWATRKKAFTHIARTRIEQSLAGVGLQLVMGLTNTSALGLIVGQIVSSGAGFWGLARRTYSFDSIALRQIDFKGIKIVAREYDRFPKYSTLEALTNVAGIQLPIILISALSSNVEVGYLSLAMRVMQVPMSFIGSSISQVFFSRAVDEDRYGNLGAFTERTIGSLVKIGVGPLIFIGIVAPSVFGVLFGSQWQRAGELVAWMTPWFIFQFLVSPISMLLHIKNKTNSALFLNIYGILLKLIAITGAFYFGYRQFLAEVFSLASIFYYMGWLYSCIKISGASFGKIFFQKNIFQVIAIWSIFSVATKFVLENGGLDYLRFLFLSMDKFLRPALSNLIDQCIAVFYENILRLF